MFPEKNKMSQIKKIERHNSWTSWFGGKRFRIVVLFWNIFFIIVTLKRLRRLHLYLTTKTSAKIKKNNLDINIIFRGRKCFTFPRNTKKRKGLWQWCKADVVLGVGDVATVSEFWVYSFENIIKQLQKYLKQVIKALKLEAQVSLHHSSDLNKPT